VSIGEVLAAARLEAGLTVTDISQRTRITRTVITAIEGDDYAACGGDFYARGHIRSIAKAVGADPEPLIREYDSAHPRPQLAEEYLTKPITPAGRRPLPRPARRPPIWASALAAGLVAALGLGGYVLGSSGDSIAPAAGAGGKTPRHTGQSSHQAAPSPSASQSSHSASSPAANAAAAPPRILHPASAAAFGFAGNGGDHGELARLAIDRNPATAWNTDWYATAHFGNLYPGTGLLINMGRPVTINSVLIRLGRAQGASLQLRVGSAPALASLRTVAQAANVGGVLHLRLARPAYGRYMLLWFTSLPPDSAGTFRGSVYGLQVQGGP
jgi:transcriptional regulator with XRE-family HTH domain